MTNSPKKQLTILFIFLIISIISIGFISGFTIDSTTNETINTQTLGSEGYLSEQNEITVVEFDIATTSVSVGTSVQSQLIIANYKDEEKTVELEPYIYDNINEELIDYNNDGIRIDNKPSDEITLEPGEHKNFIIEYTFYSDFIDNELEIGFINEGETDNENIATQNITILSEYKGEETNLLIDRGKEITSITSFTSFKDENVMDTSNPNNYMNIPPFDLEENNINEYDVAEGSVIDFINMRDSSSNSYTTMKTEGGNMNIGVQSSTIQYEDYYSLNFNYDMHDIDLLEVKVVNELGQQIDEDSKYLLSDEYEGIEERKFQLTEKETEYIKNNGEIYIIFNVDGYNGEIDFYSSDIASENDIPLADITEKDLSAEIVSEIDDVTVGDKIEIEADITNHGTQGVERDFRLFESELQNTNTTRDMKENRIINPDSTKSLNFTADIISNEKQKYYVLDDYITVEPELPAEDAIQPSIQESSDIIGEGEDILFEISGVTDEELNQIEEINWDIDTIDEDGTGESFEATFEDSGTHIVEMEVIYESQGEEVSTTIQTLIEVLEEPDIDISTYQYDFITDTQDDRTNNIISSIEGELTSETCEINCGSTFEFDGVNLATSEGLNMLVLDTNEQNQLETVSYGAYNVEEGYFAETDSITSSNMENIEDTLDEQNIVNIHSTEALINKIEEYEQEDKIILFTSGGNPQPSENEQELYDSLENLGANLNHNGEFDENSMWTFATHTHDLGNTPLDETYTTSETIEQIDTEYEIQYIDVDDTYIIPDRPVYHDMSNTVTTTDISELDIQWDLDDETITDEQIVSNIYSETDEIDIELEIEEEEISTVETKTITTDTSEPIASIPNDLFIEVEDELTLYSLDSTDIDSTIQSYEWVITDGVDEIEDNSLLPTYSWSSVGEQQVELTVEDNYGNTDTTTETVNIVGSAPEPNININNVFSDYNSGVSDTELDFLQQKPQAYYPISEQNSQINEIINNYNGEINAQQNRTATNIPMAEITDDSEITIDELAFENINEQFTISKLLYIEEEQNGELFEIQDIISGNELIATIENDELLIELLDENEVIQLTTTNIEYEQLMQLGIQYDSTTGFELYINGELEESVQESIGEIQFENIQYQVGEDVENQIPMLLSELYVYDTVISNESHTQKYTNYETPFSQQYQDIFYDFGEKYTDIEYNQGQNSDDYLLLDTETNNEEIIVENKDMQSYDYIHFTYDALIEQDMSTPEQIAEMNISVGEETETKEIYYYMESRKNGIKTIDVSDISTTEDIKININSNDDVDMNVNILEIWGDNQINNAYDNVQEFYDTFYLDTIEDIYYHETRDGIRFATNDNNGNIHNIIPITENINKLDLSYRVNQNINNMGGIHLYVDETGSYSLGTGPTNPETIFCRNSIYLQSECGTIGSQSESVTIDNVYSSIGADIGLSDDEHVVIESFESIGEYVEPISNKSNTLELDASDTITAGEGIDIESFEWDMDATTPFNADYTGEKIQHKFTDRGTHEIELRITDTQGEQVEETIEINIDNLKPDISTVHSSESNLANTVNFASVTDSNGEANIEQILWSFGDGNYETGSSTNYQYQLEDTYTITAHIIDEYGETRMEQSTINVTAEEPNLDNIPTQHTTHVRDSIIFETTGDIAENINTHEHPEEIQSEIDLTDAYDPNEQGELEFEFFVEDEGEITNPEENIHIVDELYEQNITIQATNVAGRTTTEEITIQTFNDGPQFEVNMSGSGEEIDNENIDEYTNISDEIDIEVQGYNPHPRISSEITTSGEDFPTNNIFIDEDEEPEMMTITELFDISSDVYSVEDFPLNNTVEANIIDDFEYKESEQNIFEIELRELDITFNPSPTNAIIFQDSVDMNVDVISEDSEITQLEYDFDDGNTTTQPNDNTIVTHQYLEEGTFQPSVEVQDEFGQQQTETSQVRSIVQFDDVIFLACGIDEGFEGPTQAQCDNTYEDTDLEGWVNVDDGIQEWTVPQTGVYEIQLAGARGGQTHGGEGAVLHVTDQLDRNQELRILSGLMGSTTPAEEAGGGGGTFIATEDNEPILVAGGGGAAWTDRGNQHANILDRDGQDGEANAGSDKVMDGGTDGDGGEEGSGGGEGASGGAGFFGPGICEGWSGCDPPQPFVDGGIASDMDGEGGFGGGGGGRDAYSERAGGGGGYSGGAGARGRSFTSNGYTTAGGGGSYIPTDANLLEYGHYNEFDVPEELEFDGTGYVKVELIDEPELNINLIEERESGTQRNIEENDVIEQESTLNLDATYISGQADAEIDEIVWYLGDGAIETGEEITHQYSEEGSQQITVEARTDDNVLHAFETITIFVDEIDILPVIETNVDEMSINEEIIFDASESTSEQEIIEYEWFINNQFEESSEEMTYQFEEIGEYDVRLDVETEDGQTTTTTKEIEINSEVNAEITASEQIIEEGEEIIFDASNSQIEGEEIESYEWYLNDGTIQTGEEITHQYTEPGEYNIELEVTTIDGQTDIETKQIIVEEVEIQDVIDSDNEQEWDGDGDTQGDGGDYSKEINSDNEIELYADGNCFNAPYDGAEVSMEKELELSSGTYDMNLEMKAEELGNYAFSTSDSYRNGGEVYINDELIIEHEDACYADSYSGCDTDWESFEEEFTIEDDNPTLRLEFSVGDCGDGYVYFRDIEIE